MILKCKIIKKMCTAQLFFMNKLSTIFQGRKMTHLCRTKEKMKIYLAENEQNTTRLLSKLNFNPFIKEIFLIFTNSKLGEWKRGGF